MSSENHRFDALLPAEMAERAELLGVKKSQLPFGTMFLLAILAGAFIALGAVFSTTVATGSADLPYGVARLLAGLTFCLGLILVVVAGAELFTGNNLQVMAVASGKLTPARLVRCWIIVYMGNFVGAVATAVFIVASKQYMHGSGSVGATALSIASAKCDLGFVQAFALGVLCNALVCLAVWLCLSARSTADKILAIIFPITAFVAAGFEHSVANMYFVPVAILIRDWAPLEFWEMIGRNRLDFRGLQWGRFLYGNLLPVTLGNIVGGSVMVGLVYWCIYRRNVRPS